MCNPKTSSLLTALRRGFLKGCPNLSEELVTKYLNPSPAMAKGHMKRPKKGIRSTNKKAKTKGDDVQPAPVPVPQVAPPLLPQYNEELRPYPGPEYDARLEGVNIILEDKSIANVFCFGAFTDKISGVVYNDLTGNFPPSCRSMAVSASLFCTIMSLTQYWSKPLPMLTTIAFMRRTRRYLNCWKQKDTSQK